MKIKQMSELESIWRYVYIDAIEPKLVNGYETGGLGYLIDIDEMKPMTKIYEYVYSQGRRKGYRFITEIPINPMECQYIPICEKIYNETISRVDGIDVMPKEEE